MNSKEIKNGAMLSYLLIIVNTCYGLFFTPFLISSLGDGEYGVYKIIGSFIGSLTILDLGIGSTVLRFAAKFYASDEKIELGNFAAMAMIEATAISAIMVLVSIAAYFRIDNIYDRSLTPAELGKAKQLFLLFAVILVLSTFEKVNFSLVAGCEHYAFANGLKLSRLIAKLLLSVLILHRVADSAVLLWIEIVLLVIAMIVQLIYFRKKIGIRIHLYRWNKSLFFGSFLYTLLMFIQSVAVQFNSNLDNIVIGAYIGPSAVAVYSIGLQLYNMYEQFAVAFSDLMLPTVSKQVASNESLRRLEDTVIKIGRLEFAALGGALCGYIVIGKEFIRLWLGDGYSFAWIVGLLLMVPTTIPLVQNVCLSILRAQNKMLFRTVAVCVMAVFNLLFTLIGVPKYGPIAACIGTAIGLIAANIIAMNIYYAKVIKLNIVRIFANIFSRIWLCCLISAGVLFAVNRVATGGWLIWIAKAAVFVLVYAALLFAIGFKDYEKTYLLNMFRKK